MEQAPLMISIVIVTATMMMIGTHILTHLLNYSLTHSLTHSLIVTVKSWIAIL